MTLEFSESDLDETVRRFEAAWRAGQSISIEQLLPEDPHWRLRLLWRLVAAEMELRKSQGEQANYVEYVRRFPELVDQDTIASSFVDTSSSAFSPSSAPTPAEESDIPRPAPRSPRGFETDETLPRDLGNYRLFRKLGEGGMGMVYEARPLEGGQPVALKTIRPGIARSPLEFKKEFRCLAEISHHNLVAFDEMVVQDDALPFFTMELVDGQTFLEYVRAGFDSESLSAPLIPFHEQRLRSALLQLAEGLICLHQHGKLHRDIKPTNVLVTRGEGRVVLLDFGLVVEMDEDVYRNSRHEIAGTEDYMSPEQSSGKELDFSADWYSVGVMLHEALTGRKPFTGSRDQLLRQKLAPQLNYPASAPEDLRRLCSALLMPRCEQRPKGDEILSQLKGSQLQSAKETSAPPAVWIGRDAELAVLFQAFDDVQRNQPVVVFVSGRSGMGKTSLVKHFLETIRQRFNAVILRGRCYENESVSYKAFDTIIDALTQYLRRQPRENVNTVLPLDAGSLCQMFPVLRETGVMAHLPGTASSGSDPQEMRLRGFAALRELLSRLVMVQNKLLVMFIDDIQWGDSDSAELFNELTRLPGAPALLLICSFRSEDVARSPFLSRILRKKENEQATEEIVPKPVAPVSDSTSGSGAAGRRETEFVPPRDIEVGPLPLEQAVRLARRLAPDDVQDEQIQQIARESRGIPLFVQVLAHHFAQTKTQEKAQPPCAAVEDDEGRGASSAKSEPLSLDSVLWRQICALPASEQAILEVVAAAGRPLPRNTIREAANLSGSDLVSYGDLRARRFVRTIGPKSPGDSDQVEAYHDRIRETILRYAPAQRMVERYARLAELLEKSIESKDAEQLADLYAKSRQLQKAGEWYSRAADESLEALAFRRAARLFQQALDYLQPTGAQQRRLRVSLGDALSHIGRTAAAARQYIQAAQSADADGEIDQAAEYRCRAAQRYLTSGHLKEGLEVLSEVLASVGLKLPPNSRRALMSLAWRRVILFFRGLKFSHRTRNEISNDDRRLLDVCWAAAAGLSVVDPIRAADYTSRNLLIALRVGEPHYLVRGLTAQVGHMAIRGGKSRRAITPYLRKTRQVARLHGGEYARAAREVARGVAAHLQGRWSAAVRSCDRAVEHLLHPDCKDVAWELNMARTFACWALMYAGDVKELTRRQGDLLRTAQENNDLFAQLNFGTIVAMYVHLGADQVVKARQQLKSDKTRLSDQAFYVQHHNWLLGATFLKLYEADAEAAWNLIHDGWRGYKMSSLGLVHQVRTDFLQTQARAALAMAAAADDPQTYLDLVRRITHRLARENMQWSTALATLLEAGAAAAGGDLAQSAERLRTAKSQLEAVRMQLFSAAAEARLSQLLGESPHAAYEKIRSLGAKNPARMVAAFAPGFVDLP